MVDLTPLEQQTTEAPSSPLISRQRGPIIFAAVLAIAGVLYTLLGSVTVVPFLSDERRREPIRSMWMALSRELPDIGHAGLAKFGFWLVVILTAALCVALMLVAATVTDAAEPETDQAA
jgi:hypothetical protein